MSNITENAQNETQTEKYAKYAKYVEYARKPGNMQNMHFYASAYFGRP